MTHTSDDEVDEVTRDVLIAMFAVIDAAMDATNTLRADPEFRDDGTLEPLFVSLDRYCATLLRIGVTTTPEDYFKGYRPFAESD